MAKKKGSKKFKSGLPLDVEEKILAMPPTDLAVEVTFERNAIETLNKQMKEDHQLEMLKKTTDKFETLITEDKDVAKAKEAYEEAKEAYDNAKAEAMDEDHVEAVANLSALKKGWKDDIKDRKKKLVYMEKTLKRHIELGTLKRK